MNKVNLSKNEKIKEIYKKFKDYEGSDVHYGLNKYKPYSSLILIPADEDFKNFLKNYEYKNTIPNLDNDTKQNISKNFSKLNVLDKNREKESFFVNSIDEFIRRVSLRKYVCKECDKMGTYDEIFRHLMNSHALVLHKYMKRAIKYMDERYYQNKTHLNIATRMQYSSLISYNNSIVHYPRRMKGFELCAPSILNDDVFSNMLYFDNASESDSEEDINETSENIEPLPSMLTSLFEKYSSLSGSIDDRDFAFAEALLLPFADDIANSLIPKQQQGSVKQIEESSKTDDLEFMSNMEYVNNKLEKKGKKPYLAKIPDKIRDAVLDSVSNVFINEIVSGDLTQMSTRLLTQFKRNQKKKLIESEKERKDKEKKEKEKKGKERREYIINSVFASVLNTVIQSLFRMNIKEIFTKIIEEEREKRLKEQKPLVITGLKHYKGNLINVISNFFSDYGIEKEADGSPKIKIGYKNDEFYCLLYLKNISDVKKILDKQPISVNGDECYISLYESSIMKEEVEILQSYTEQEFYTKASDISIEKCYTDMLQISNGLCTPELCTLDN